MQWDDALRDPVQRLAPLVVWVLAGLGLSLLVALIREPLSRILRDAADQLGTARQRYRVRAAVRLGRKANRFWTARLHEPSRPLNEALDQLIQVLPRAGKHSLARLGALEAELAKSLRQIQALTLHAPTAEMLGGGTNPAAAPGSWTRLYLLVLVAALTGIANSFLLNQFFQGVITSDPLLPSAAPGLHVSHVLAALIFLMEVGIGFALHHFSEERSDSPAQQFLATAPWVVLGGLVCLEGWAYALLSYQIDLPARLNLSPESGLYPFARYFLALFGAGLTLLLTSIGYLLGKEAEGLRRGREQRRQRRLLRRFSRAIAGGPDRLARTQRALDHLKATAQSFQPDLAEQFRREIHSVTADLIAAAGRIDRQPENSQVRTQSQVLADIALFSGALLVLVLVSRLSVEYVAAFVEAGNGGSSAPAAGVLLTAFGLAAGYLAARRTRHRVLALGAIALAAGSLIAIAIANRTLGSWWPLNGLFGLIHAGVLLLLGASFERAVVSSVHLLQLAGLFLAGQTVWLGCLLLLAARGLLLGLDWAFRVLAVFGQLIVRPRAAVRLGVVEVARSQVREKHG